MCRIHDVNSVTNLAAREPMARGLAASGFPTGTGVTRPVRNRTIEADFVLPSSRPSLALTPYRPDLFFTANGESVMFDGIRMSVGNRPFVKTGLSDRSR